MKLRSLGFVAVLAGCGGKEESKAAPAAAPTKGQANEPAKAIAKALAPPSDEVLAPAAALIRNIRAKGKLPADQAAEIKKQLDSHLPEVRVCAEQANDEYAGTDFELVVAANGSVTPKHELPRKMQSKNAQCLGDAMQSWKLAGPADLKVNFIMVGPARPRNLGAEYLKSVHAMCDAIPSDGVPRSPEVVDQMIKTVLDDRHQVGDPALPFVFRDWHKADPEVRQILVSLTLAHAGVRKCHALEALWP